MFTECNVGATRQRWLCAKCLIFDECLSTLHSANSSYFVCFLFAESLRPDTWQRRAMRLLRDGRALYLGNDEEVARLFRREAGCHRGFQPEEVASSQGGVGVLYGDRWVGVEGGHFPSGIGRSISWELEELDLVEGPPSSRPSGGASAESSSLVGDSHHLDRPPRELRRGAWLARLRTSFKPHDAKPIEPKPIEPELFYCCKKAKPAHSLCQAIFEPAQQCPKAGTSNRFQPKPFPALLP